MSSDLAARARRRAEECKQAASGIPAPPYSYRSWQHDDWGMVRNHQGPVANTAMQSIISRWRAEVYDKIEGDPRPAWEAGPPETQALGEFLVHAANTATDQVALLRALADRVDEQERRIKELEGENDRLRKSFAREVRRADCFGMERFMLAMLCADTPYFKDEQSIAAAKKIRDEALETLSQKGGE